MTLNVMESLAAQAKSRFQFRKVTIVYGLGRLEIGAGL